MRNLEKSRELDADDPCSSINRLPDEIILEILNKLIDLKTLCFCYLVSRRFSSIVLQVDAVSFTVPFLNPSIPDKNTLGDVDRRTFHGKILSLLMKPVTFLSKYIGVKFLRIELPSSTQRTIDNRSLFKWRVKFGSRVESFIFLSPNSICDSDEVYLNGNWDEEEENELSSNTFKQNCLFQCLMDAIVRHRILLSFVKNLPMLKEVSIIDSGGRGRLSLSGEKLSDVKEWVNSASETEMDIPEVPVIVSKCYIPVLKLPVSGYVMKGVYFGLIDMNENDLQGGNDGLMNSENGFEDKEEAAYTEAVMEILEKHQGMMRTMQTVF